MLQVNNMNEENLKKAKKLKTFIENKDLAFLDELELINENLKSIADKEEKEITNPLPVEIKGAEIITIKGEKGDKPIAGIDYPIPKDGKTPTDEHLIELIKPLIPEPIAGKDGRDGKNGIGRNGTDGKDADPVMITQDVIKALESMIPKSETVEELAEKLNLQEALDKIASLEKEIKKVAGKIPIISGNGRSSHSTHFYDLSSQTNDILKVFAVPKNMAGVLFSSDSPTVLMEGNGFTLNATRTQLTITAQNAPSAGSQLLFSYTGVFNTKK